MRLARRFRREEGERRKEGRYFGWLLRKKKGFDWLLRREGGRESMILISCCGGREEIGQLGRCWRGNAFTISFYLVEWVYVKKPPW